MANTRSQTARNNITEANRMDRYSDNGSECIVSEVLSRDQMTEFENGGFLDRRVNIGQNSVDRRFSEVDRQISDLTSLVLALTEKISSTNREGNRQLTASNTHETSSDTCVIELYDISFYPI